MPRPPRIEYEHAFHHVMNRGRHKRAIFLEDKDFEAFQLTKTFQTATFEIYRTQSQVNLLQYHSVL